MPDRPSLKLVRPEDHEALLTAGGSVRDLERTILDHAQGVAATMSLAGQPQAACTEQAVLALCDAVHDLNALIVAQGCPSKPVAYSGNPVA